MEFAKGFIFIYAIFTILLMLYSQTNNLGVFPEIIFPETFDLISIIIFFGSFISFIFSLLIYSIKDNFIVNILLWSYRVVALIEILLYAKKLINPAAN